MRVSDAVAARGAALVRIEVYDARGGLIQRIDLDGGRKPFGHATVGLYHALLRALHSAVNRRHLDGFYRLCEP